MKTYDELKRELLELRKLKLILQEVCSKNLRDRYCLDGKNELEMLDMLDHEFHRLKHLNIEDQLELERERHIESFLTQP